MTEKPLVSVIINCFNGEKYLRETIDSVIAQTYENWELVFWDNQSTDSTREIVESFNNPKIKYFYAPEHTPLGEARNLALENANGEIIAFLDSDDKWKTEWINICVQEFLKNDNLSIVFCRFYVVTPNTQRLNKLLLPEMDAYILPIDFIEKYSLGMSGAAFKKSIQTGNNIYFEKSFSLIEDYDFFIRLACYGGVKFISTPLFYYREHGNNLSHISSAWGHELKILKTYIMESRSSYSLLSPYIDAINNKIWNYDFYDLITEKKYLKALIKHPRAFYYMMKNKN